LFESFVVSDLLKARFNKGEEPNLHFWRDKNGHEIDCLVERSSGPLLVEIKSGKTVTEDFFSNLQYYRKLAGMGSADSYVVYGGDQEQKRSYGQVVPWNKLPALAPVTG